MLSVQLTYGNEGFKEIQEFLGGKLSYKLYIVDIQ